MHFLNKRLLVLLAFPGVFASCSKIDEIIPDNGTNANDEATEYTINSGDHEISNSFKPLQTNKIKFSVKFDNTAKYSTQDPANQADINKLYGMSDCRSFHHINSARFGWRWFNNKLEILAYSYAGGVNTSTLVTAINLNKWYTCEITLEDGKYVFQAGKKKVEHPRGCSGEGIGYQLYPYFGGDETAPQKINIMIKDIK